MKIYYWLLLIIIVFGGFFLFSHTYSPQNAAVLQALPQYEIASTSAEQVQGLSGREEAPKDGMLFVFQRKDNYGFWMKDMLIPIDIIWLNADGTIAGILDSVSPDTYPQIFYPPHAVQYVLETKAGMAKEKGWEVGTKLPLPK